VQTEKEVNSVRVWHIIGEHNVRSIRTQSLLLKRKAPRGALERKAVAKDCKKLASEIEYAGSF
jgi:hypothetical protein